MNRGLEQEIAEQARRADGQRAEASRALRVAAARAARAGMSQRKIAVLLRRSQPEVRRLLHASAATDAAGRPRVWMTARSAVDAIADELAAGDEAMALRMAVQSLTHLRSLTDPRDIAEWEVEPLPIKDQRWDALWCALARRTIEELGRPVPEWADPKPLMEEWVLARLRSRYQRTKAATPPDLAALNIYVTEKDLATA